MHLQFFAGHLLSIRLFPFLGNPHNLSRTGSDQEVFTDYLGGINLESVRRLGIPQKVRQAELENGVREALESGGHLRLVYRPDVKELWVVTEYEARRRLSEEELAFLAGYTRGQWSDGIGENFLSVSEELYGLTVDCSRVGDPTVEQS
jgi:hypothetical protein